MAAGLLFLASGCKQKDAEKCAQALNVTRQALEQENFDLATQWRDYAYKNCDDQAGLQALDQEIVEKRQAVHTREQQEAAEKKKAEALLGVFTSFVANHRAKPSGASASPECEEPAKGKPKDSKERWCSATRALSGAQQSFRVRYWEAEPEAVLFAMKPVQPVKCDALGGNKVIQTWPMPAVGGKTATRTHCEIVSGPLSGMHALVTEASNADLFVFTPKYLEHDAGFKKRASGG